MLIPIDDNHRIKGTEHSWQVEHRRVRKAGKDIKRLGVKKGERYEEWEPVTYHGSLATAVRSLGERQVRTACDIANALDRVKTLHDAVQTWMDCHLSGPVIDEEKVRASGQGPGKANPAGVQRDD